MLVKYEIKPEVRDRLANDYTHWPPVDDQGERYSAIRGLMHNVAVQLCQACPPSRELSVALTHLEQVVFFANASIARNEPRAG